MFSTNNQTVDFWLIHQEILQYLPLLVLDRL